MSAPDGLPGPGPRTFDEVYQTEFSYVWRTLGRLGVARADLPDAVHDSFVVVYRRWSELDLDRPLRPWLFGVARRVAATARRRQAAAPEPEVEAVVTPTGHGDHDLLWRALARVDDDRREIIVLHDLEGYTGAEIAALLDLPVNTVHSRLRLGRADLLAAVRKLEGGR